MVYPCKWQNQQLQVEKVFIYSEMEFLLKMKKNEKCETKRNERGALAEKKKKLNEIK